MVVIFLFLLFACIVWRENHHVCFMYVLRLCFYKWEVADLFIYIIQLACSSSSSSSKIIYNCYNI